MITEAQIIELKAKYGNDLDLITLDLENGKTKEYIIRVPTRSVIESISETETKDTEAARTLIANCVIYGDLEAIEKDGKIYMTLINAIRAKIRNYKFDVKKL